MDRSQSFEIQNTQNISYQIATTALTDMEISTIELPPNVSISSVLTPKTRFLVTYKAVFTEKYIQALLWNIPIVTSQFLYDPTLNYKAFEMRPFQGAVFTTSGISDETYNNYFILLGAKYEQNCTIFIDFLVCDNEDSEKYRFCRKYEIPIIKTSQVFSGNYVLFKKKTKYDARQLRPKAMFFEKVFFIDPKLPKQLFNKLRRIVIENEGTRVSSISEDTEYVVTLSYDEYREHSSKLIHYQYIFDCFESNSLLYSDFYRYHFPISKIILQSTISVVDKDMENAGEYVYKLKSLGSNVRNSLDSRCTHYVAKDINLNSLKPFIRDSSSQTGRQKGDESRLPFMVLSPDWVDQCLILLKHVKEGRFSTNRPTLSLRKRLSLKKQEEMVFQFTGLPSLFKDEAIRKFRSFGIKFVDSDKFEGCTHLIMGSLSSSEKFFCSLVSGCWILTPDFIQDFENQANFDFEKYEWTSSDDMTQRDKKTVDSIRKWRTRIQDTRRKPFHRWNAKFYCPEYKLDNYKNLILAGGGSMDDSRPYTHIFVDKNYGGEIKEDKSVSADSIFSYLFK